ncbi:MAG: N-acetylmuramoyl-L-alanine amidase [Bdellovibrionales bacterium]|nr:N-acetylmuramoyl-L-alanine amidase [Bdellovibrionales bacterium]
MRRLIVLVFIFSVAVNVNADSANDAYQMARKNYFSLRNTDLEVKELKKWLTVGRELVSISEKYKNHETAPAALFNAGVLYSQVYKVHKTEDHLERALLYFEMLVQRYPDHYLADDALIKRGDLFLDFKKDRDKAEASYLEVVEAYPNADLYEVAEQKLAKLTGRSFEKSTPKEHVLTTVEEPELENNKAKDEPIYQDKKSEKNTKFKDKIIVIDPGHGGEDFGAVGKSGLYEKDITLLIALQLEKLIESELGATVRLTRRSDIFVPLAERTNLANDFEAALFISLHVNSSEKNSASGYETYYLDNTDSAASAKLAERENASIQFEGPQADLQFMLSDLIQSAKRDESIALANLVQQESVSHLKLKWKNIQSRGVKTAPFYVLVGAHMPCILVEMFFINHPEESVRLSKENFRLDLAKGILTGIDKFFKLEAKSP